MDQTEYRQLQESGGLVTDAALQEEVVNEIIEDDRYAEEEPEIEEEEAPADEPENTVDDDSEPEEELTPKEKTAFEKRLERERVKEREKIEAEYKQKYSKHDEVIQSLGGDADKLLQAAKDAKLAREAEQLAYSNGWSDEDKQWYIEDQKNKQELKELRVQMQISKLMDNPDYAGIGSMEKDILAKIDKSNGSLNVEEAFFALGGSKRIEQVKLEAQQREIALRNKPTRTVQKDAPSNNTGEKPLDPKVLAEAKRAGMSEAEARKVMNAPVFNNIDEYREYQRKNK